MSSKLYMIQANIRKSQEATHSFCHNLDFELAYFLFLTESYTTLDGKNHSILIFFFYIKW